MNNGPIKTKRQIPANLERAWRETVNGTDLVQQAASTLEFWSWCDEARDRHKTASRLADTSRNFWVQVSLRAVQNGDIDFFRRVADAYEQRQREPAENKAFYF